MTEPEYVALKKQLEDAKTLQASLTQQLEKLSQMITALATALGRTGVSPSPPIINTVNNTVTGTGINQHTYSGATWVQFPKTGMYQDNGAYNNTVNDYIDFKFYGYKAEWYSEKFPSHGISAVSVDGGAETNVDQYNATEQENQLLYTTGVLTEGQHTVRLRITGTKNASSTGTYLVHDYFKVYATQVSVAPDPGGDTFDLYVATDGLVGNPGTKAQPTTAARAALIATTGQRVAFRGGTYHETIAPTNNGVTYLAYPGETVIISGLNQISNGAWTSHDLTGGKSIYKATLSNGAMFTEYMTGFNSDNFQYNNTQLLAQQIFKDGEMQMLASFPKVSSTDGLLERSAFRSTVNAPNFGPTTITDSGFSPYGNLTGGIVCIQGWFIYCTRTITGHSGNTITYGSTNDGGDHAFSKFYRVTGKLGLLTQAKEWHYESNTLYFWQQGGGSPTGVEYKARNWGFDLRGKTDITITGFQFIGCEPVMTTTASARVIIDNIRAKYTSHHLLETRGGNGGYNDSTVQTGTKLLGTDSILRNSEFNFSSGVTVWVGSNVTVQNNKFENGDYGGFYGCFVKPTWSGLTGASSWKVINNTFSRSARGSIEMTANAFGTTYSNFEIGYNDFSAFIKINVDSGAIYAARYTKTPGARIHHNHFHNDGGFNEAGTGQQRGIQVNGVYFDMASGGNAQLDHNIHWNGVNGAGRSGAYAAEYYAQTHDAEHGNTALTNNLYCNTFATTNSGGGYSYVDYTPKPNIDMQKLNIYRAGIVIDWNFAANGDNVIGCLHNGQTGGSNPLFVGGSLSSPQNYFQLQAGSPARGISGGMSLPGVNDNDVAPYDAGAIPYGTAGFVTGYAAVSYNP